jgi:hypothetical protein
MKTLVETIDSGNAVRVAMFALYLSQIKEFENSEIHAVFSAPWKWEQEFSEFLEISA